jgi:Recombinase
MRRICRRLYEDGIPSPSGKTVWSIVCISGMLANPTYKGRARYNRHQSLPPTTGPKSTRLKLRPPEEWIEISVPAILSEDLFDAAQRVLVITRTSARGGVNRISGSCGVWSCAGIAASKAIARTSGVPPATDLATTCATGGDHSRPADPTGLARNRPLGPKSWTRWCGSRSDRLSCGPTSW